MSWFYWFTLLYFSLFVCSTKTSTCNNYSYQKYNQETKNNSSFFKTPVSKRSVCLSLQKKKTALKHLQFRRKESHMFWHVYCQNNVKPMRNTWTFLFRTDLKQASQHRKNRFSFDIIIFFFIVIPFVKLFWNICRGWLVFHSIQRKCRCFYQYVLSPTPLGCVNAA